MGRNVKCEKFTTERKKCEKFTTTDYGQISLRKARLSLQPRWAKSKTLDCPMSDKRITKRDQLDWLVNILVNLTDVLSHNSYYPRVLGRGGVIKWKWKVPIIFYFLLENFTVKFFKINLKTWRFLENSLLFIWVEKKYSIIYVRFSFLIHNWVSP